MSVVTITRKNLNRFRLVNEPGTFPAIVLKLDTTGKPSKSGKSTVYEGMIELKGGVNDGVMINIWLNNGMEADLLSFAAACANETQDEFYPADAGENIDVNLDACIGKEFGATIEYDTYQNKMKNSFAGAVPLKLMEAPFGE